MWLIDSGQKLRALWRIKGLKGSVTVSWQGGTLTVHYYFSMEPLTGCVTTSPKQGFFIRGKIGASSIFGDWALWHHFLSKFVFFEPCGRQSAVGNGNRRDCSSRPRQANTLSGSCRQINTTIKKKFGASRHDSQVFEATPTAPITCF